MNIVNSPFSVSAAQRPSTYSIYKRLANLALVVVAGLICVNLWLLSTDQASNWRDKQASQLGRSLVSYGAKVIAPDLAHGENQRITMQLKMLSSDPHVQGAAIFNHRGEIIDSTHSNTSVLASFLLNDNAPLVFVEEVRDDNKILGYLRILLDKQQVMQYHDDYQLQLYEQLLVLMILAALAGLLVTRAYYKFRFRHYVKVKS